MSCSHCSSWGETITRKQNPSAIACPECKRLTWPNLGVNCPAGSAVSFGVTQALEVMRVGVFYIPKKS